MNLPPPHQNAEDHWIETLLEFETSRLLELSYAALEQRRVRLAGRIACLLEEEEITEHPDLSRARKAALFQLHEGGLKTQEIPEEIATLRRRRRQRILRSKNRHRRGVNPKDPRFRRK